MNTTNNVLHESIQNKKNNIIAKSPQEKEGKCRSKAYALFFGMLHIFGGFYIGFYMAQFSTFFEYFIRGKFKGAIEPREYDNIQSLLNTIIIFRGIVSTIASVKIIETQSPKIIVYSLSLGMIIFVFIQVWLPLPVIYVCRFFIGFIMVFYSFIHPQMVNHCCPSKFSGFVGSMFGFFIGIGVLVASSVTSDISEKYWYIFLCIPLPIELFRLIMFFFVFPIESPYYVFEQIEKNLKNESKNIEKNTEKDLKKIENSNKNKENDKTNQQELIKKKFLEHKEINKIVNAFYVKEDIESHKIFLFNSIFRYQEEKKKSTGVFSTMCSKEFKKPFLMGILLNLANQLTGINVIILYSKQIYTSLNFSNPELFVFLGSKFNKLL